VESCRMPDRRLISLSLFGATYMVLSPEHSYVSKYMDRLENADEVREYQEQAARKSDFERSELSKEKTGVPLKGLSAINPVTGKEIPYCDLTSE